MFLARQPGVKLPAATLANSAVLVAECLGTDEQSRKKTQPNLDVMRHVMQCVRTPLLCAKQLALLALSATRRPVQHEPPLNERSSEPLAVNRRHSGGQGSE